MLELGIAHRQYTFAGMQMKQAPFEGIMSHRLRIFNRTVLKGVLGGIYSNPN